MKNDRVVIPDEYQKDKRHRRVDQLDIGEHRLDIDQRHIGVIMAGQEIKQFKVGFHYEESGTCVVEARTE